MVTGARVSDLKSVLLHLVVGRAPHVQLLMLLCVVLHWASQGKLKFASLQICSGVGRLQLSRGGIGTKGCGRSPSQAFLYKSINSYRMIMIPCVH